ncbi:MAG: hypothetical protein WBY53_10520, partial [Acidobacteriaceae bacterium]
MSPTGVVGKRYNWKTFAGADERDGIVAKGESMLNASESYTAGGRMMSAADVMSLLGGLTLGSEEGIQTGRTAATGLKAQGSGSVGAVDCASGSGESGAGEDCSGGGHGCCGGKGH